MKPIYKIKFFAFILFLIFHPSTITGQIIDSAANSDCVFDLKTQTDDFIKNKPEFSNYIWNNSTKEATIYLKNKDTLKVTRGGCTHFSYYGKLFSSSFKNFELQNTDYWLKEGLDIAFKLFDSYDYKLLSELIKNKKYTIESNNENQLYSIFEQERFCNMSLLVEKDIKLNKLELTIGYYLC